MLTVRFFGKLRLDFGLAQMDVEAENVKELISYIAKNSAITSDVLKDCMVVANGKAAKKSTKLSDGDEIMLLSPASGG